MPAPATDDPRPLPLAAADGTLDGAALRGSADAVLALAESLDAGLDDALDVPALQSIARTQQDLRSAAGRLISAQIRQLAGEAAVSAAHIADAVDYARGVLAAAKALGRRLRLAAELVAFLGTVASGAGGNAIVTAAVKLRAALDTP